MTNLLRSCENCVNSIQIRNFTNVSKCSPKLPDWILEQLYDLDARVVNNTEAEFCEAFRLRDIGENRNV